MIKSVLVLLCSIINYTSFAQENDLQRDGLKGNVKSVSKYVNSSLTKFSSYDRKGHNVEFILYCYGGINKVCGNAKLQYDSKGNKIKSIEDIFSTIYKYDKNNNLLEQIQSYTNSNKMTLRLKYEYVKGRKVSVEQYDYFENKEKLIYKTEYIYNEKNYLIQEILHTYSFKNTNYKFHQIKKIVNLYDGNGNNISKTTFFEGIKVNTDSSEYDNKNRKIMYNQIFPNKSASYKEVYKYDDSDHLIEVANYTSNGLLMFKTIYTFNNGKNTKRVNFTSSGRKGETQYSYNQLNQLIEELNYINDSLTTRKTHQYDKNGNEIEVNHYDGQDKLNTNFKSKIEYYYL